MTYSKAGADRRLERLERVLAGRRARLAASLARRERRIVYSGPVGDLQRYGYPVALLIALAAVLPTLIGFGWRRRKKKASRAATKELAVQKLRKRIRFALPTGRRS